MLKYYKDMPLPEIQRRVSEILEKSQHQSAKKSALMSRKMAKLAANSLSPCSQYSHRAPTQEAPGEGDPMHLTRNVQTDREKMVSGEAMLVNGQLAAAF